jgi:hypothetical protein
LPGLLHALNESFEACAADADCNSAFPNLRNVWLETLNRFNEEPVEIEAINPLTGERFGVLLNAGNLTFPMRMLLSDGAIGTIPLFIDMVNRGDYSLVERSWGGIARRVEFTTWGSMYSVWCSEREPLSSRQKLEAAIVASPEVGDYYADGPLEGRMAFEVCERWDVQPAPAKDTKLVRSQIPTLLMMGQFDSATNFDDAFGVASNLENSYGPYVFPAMGHVVGLGDHDCPAAVEAAFIMDPTTEPDASCIAQMPDPQFVLELGGSGDIELVAYMSDLFEGVVPDGWNELQPGIFARSNPDIDKTLLVQMAAPADFAGEMVSGMLGEFGLSELPEPLRTIPTESLTWRMYLPAGMVPMIIAKAETDQATYLALLVAGRAEPEDLADTVLLPVVSALMPNP